MKAPKYR